MTVIEYRKMLGWSQRELARRAKIDPNTARKAEQGGVISSQTALAIAGAFEEALGRRIIVADIQGLNVSI